MALVGYSDSESSDDESSKTIKKSTGIPAVPPPTSKPNIPKRKDNGEPHKIKISLPTPQADEGDVQEPAAKKAKTSGGGFNAMLPAPKRQKPALASSARGRGLGPGVNLKTGAAPGFSREVPEPESELEVQEEDMQNGYEDRSVNGSSNTAENNTVPEPPKKTGSAMRFKPLSVTRKPKKKPIAAMPTTITEVKADKTPVVKPKVSLFSTPIADEEISSTTTTTYEPIIHNSTSQAQDDDAADLQDPSYTTSAQDSLQPNMPQQATSLSSIADSLNLSASQRRQLMGRKGAGLDFAKVHEFNTETEYAANEELRARGETVAFNPVRSVMGGKHSLQSLVNLVSNQKEALKDSFAKGKMNKKEAGAKYGW